MDNTEFRHLPVYIRRIKVLAKFYGLFLLIG